VIDAFLLSWQCLTRPIIVGPIAGLILGDLKTGIILGASLESIFMGISYIGGSVASDPTSATLSQLHSQFFPARTPKPAWRWLSQLGP
jgi:PTS system mannose-specific IIC component/fructoselysine and glucoselysine-specific PTS system IIC component